MLVFNVDDVEQVWKRHEECDKTANLETLFST